MGILEFSAGVLSIVAPKHNIPIALGALAVKGATGVIKAALKPKPLPSTFQSNGSNGQNSGKSSGAQINKPDPADLEWRHISCTLKQKDGSQRYLLKNISGQARAGRVLAIMGASGAGKTTMLNVLAGQLAYNASITLTGEIQLDKQHQAISDVKVAFVQQEDIFYSQLSARETLTMLGKLRLPKAMPEEQQQALVDATLQRLGLVKCADTIVGDAKTRGLSGGEKKRLSIACELLASPQMIFVDEPTTGLDSFQALKVLETLKALAADGHTVICSIHQPRSSIFNMFDDLLLLADGQTVYFGPAKEALTFFKAQGHDCPVHFNPAEFLADTISYDYTSQETEASSRKRVAGLIAAFGEKQGAAGAAGAAAVAAQKKQSARDGVVVQSSILKQLRMLLKRSWRQITRDKATAFSRLSQNMFSALVFGSIFWRMKMTQSGIQDRLGLLQVVAVNSVMSSMVKTLYVFPNESNIVKRERSKGCYNVWTYFASKLMAELPVNALYPLLFSSITYPMTGLNPNPKRYASFMGIVTLTSFTASAYGLTIGSLSPSVETAVALGPALMVIFIVFGGYYANPDNVPPFLRWLPKVSMIKQGFEALCVNELDGLQFEANKAGDISKGQTVLDNLSFGETSVTDGAISQTRIMLFFWWASFYILLKKKPQYQPLLPPQA